MTAPGRLATRVDAREVLGMLLLAVGAVVHVAGWAVAFTFAA